MPMPTRFAILNINPSNVWTVFMESCFHAMHEFHYNWTEESGDPFCTNLCLTHSGPYLDDGRNKAVERALDRTDADIFLFVDSDVAFTPNDIRLLMSHDFDAHPVIAGSYRNLFATGWSPVVYTHRSLDPDTPVGGAMDLNPIGDDGWDLLWPIDDDENLRGCHVVGAGFLAITRDMLDTLGKKYGKPCPWFAEAISQDRTHLGEDTTFCLRVLEEGIEVCVDPRITLAHVKPILIAGKPDPHRPDTLAIPAVDSITVLD